MNPHIDNYSAGSYFVIPKFNNVALSNATCFFYIFREQYFLITNYHVVSGKNSITNELLSEKCAVPNKLSVRVFRNQEELAWEFIDFDVVDQNDKKLWFEHAEHGRIVDVVALPIKLPDHLKVVTIKEAGEIFNDATKAEVGQDLFIIGYPFGISGGTNLPIWKRASVASEPQLDVDGLPKLYVDTASRSGMSGSPVVMKSRRGNGVGDDKGNMSWYFTKLIGIYSGRIGAEDELKAQLGIVWKESVIEEIIISNLT